MRRLRSPDAYATVWAILERRGFCVPKQPAPKSRVFGDVGLDGYDFMLIVSEVESTLGIHVDTDWLLDRPPRVEVAAYLKRLHLENVAINGYDASNPKALRNLVMGHMTLASFVATIRDAVERPAVIHIK
ncbi:hypothetical protein HYW18_02865 [Candidatus Uhrbacteria bacterium]|nr:hypothetical protein [Candidatus Uhrbacteria bacterium]